MGDIQKRRHNFFKKKNYTETLTRTVKTFVTKLAKNDFY